MNRPDIFRAKQPKDNFNSPVSLDRESRTEAATTSNKPWKIALIGLELFGMACMLYAILELARYIIVYHQEHPDFYLTWGLYIELTGLAIGLVYWAVVFRRVLHRFARTLDE